MRHKWSRRLAWLLLAVVVFSNRWADDEIATLYCGITHFVGQQNRLERLWLGFLHNENPKLAVLRLYHFVRTW